jgi:hypothetical protein
MEYVFLDSKDIEFKRTRGLSSLEFVMSKLSFLNLAFNYNNIIENFVNGGSVYYNNRIVVFRNFHIYFTASGDVFKIFENTVMENAENYDLL